MYGNFDVSEKFSLSVLFSFAYLLEYKSAQTAFIGTNCFDQFQSHNIINVIENGAKKS